MAALANGRANSSRQFPNAARHVLRRTKNSVSAEDITRPSKFVLPFVKKITRGTNVGLVAVPNATRNLENGSFATELLKCLNNPFGHYLATSWHRNNPS